MDKAFVKNLLTLCLEQNLQQMLQKSYKDYHVKGFNSLILSCSDAVTLRLYICKPGETELNDQNDNILVHNHGFNFQTQVLLGSMENAVYEVSPTATEQGLWHKYIYKSALKHQRNNMNLEFLEQTYLELTRLEKVKAGESYFLRHHQLHRIFVPADRLVAMLFWQHRKVDQTPLIFSKVSQPAIFPTSGLYNRFSSIEEISDLIQLVIQNL